MTIDEAIENLKKAKAEGKKNIVFAWWDSESFGRKGYRSERNIKCLTGA